MEKYYKHDQGGYFPMPFQIICAIIGIGGLPISLASPFIGLPMVALGVFVLFSRCGIEVDFNKLAYRDYWGPLGLKFGKWEQLPELDYISIFKAKISETLSSRVSSISLENEEIQVNLITTNRKRITIFESEDKNKALGKAWKFAEYFNIGILDATTHEQEWIKE